MLPKKLRYSFSSRLPKHTIRSDYFTLRYEKNNSGSCTMAFVVSKRVYKEATKRNALKRRFLKLLSSHINMLSGGYDMVFYAKQPITTLGSEEMKDHIRIALTKIV